MKKRKFILLIISLILIIIPFFINVYSIYKLISICLGIILLDVFFAMRERINIFMLVYLPILLIIFTYGVDYLKTYTLNLIPIYIFENKINEKISVYNSLFYRIYKCNDEYIFDNNYEKNFQCKTKDIKNIDISKLLTEPLESYKEYKNNFIKVTGKISKINGNSSIVLQDYTKEDGSINGYVKFNETSKLIIKLKDINISNYHIYDYITIVGLIESYEKDNQELILINPKIEENKLYNDFTFHVIESSDEKVLKEYIDNYYIYGLDNIYLDYKIDKYELSYAIKDKKIDFEKYLEKIKSEEKENIKIYKHEKFNIINCSRDKSIFVSKSEKIDYSLCEE